MEIVVKKDFTPTDLKRARHAAAVFRVSRATSAVTNVLDQVDLGKTIILCDDHVHQFADKKTLTRYGYRQITDYPYVMGNCDYCKVFGKSQAFLREDNFAEVWRTKEQRRQDHEYAAIVSG